MDKALCKGCLYQEPKQGGWCYMFGREPDYCLKNEEINGKLYPAIDTEHGKEIERLRKALKDIDDITPDMASSLTSASDIFQTIVKIIEQALKEE